MTSKQANIGGILAMLLQLHSTLFHVAAHHLSRKLKDSSGIGRSKHIG